MRASEGGVTPDLWEPRVDASKLAEYRELYRVLRAVAPRVLGRQQAASRWSTLKFVARGLLYKKWLLPWFVFLNHPALQRLAAREPGMLLRVQWPYINRGYSAARRLDLIRAHYRFMLGKVTEEMVSALFSGSSITLAEWPVPAFGNFRLSLGHAQEHGQEGEMALSLKRAADGYIVYFLQFTVGELKTGEPELVIGCLQGGSPHVSGEGSGNKALVAQLTRHMMGSRPRNLLIFALRRIAENWDVSHIRAVSTQRQIFRQHVRFDYNKFWREVGGTPWLEGMFDIPRQGSSLADVGQVPPKRRALYRRRCHLWEKIGCQIDAALQMRKSALDAINC